MKYVSQTLQNLVKCFFPPIHHKNKSNFVDSTRCCENLWNSSKTLYLQEIRLLVKGIVRLNWLQWVAYPKFYQNSSKLLKWCIWIRKENKSISSLIGALFQKIWLWLEIWIIITLIRPKAIIMVRIGSKRNTSPKLW